MSQTVKNQNAENATLEETVFNAENGDAVIKINHLSKSFGDHEVLKDIDFEVRRGDVTCIIGSSGSGKSTLLRCINLFENPTSGEILFNGEDIVTAKKPSDFRKKVGMVFQSFNQIGRAHV